MADLDIDWKIILKDALVIIILGIIYLIICINCIVLVKLFPHYKSRKNLDEQNQQNQRLDVPPIFENQTIIDAIFPTDMTIPPYSSIQSAENLQFNEEEIQKATQPTQPTKRTKPTQGGNKELLDYNPDYIQTSSDQTDCIYQSGESNWSNSLHKFIEGMYSKYRNDPKFNTYVEWPYNWLEKYESNKNANWTSWYFKYKIANMITNQQWFARSVMKSLLKQDWWSYIPDWILFLSIPLGPNLITSLTPLLPAVIGIWLTFVVGLVISVVTIMTFFWIWLPPTEHKFVCNTTLDEPTLNKLTGESTPIAKEHRKSERESCSPGFFGQLGMSLVLIFSGWLFMKSLSWWRNGVDINPNGWFSWFEKIIKELGDLALLLVVIVTFAIFMYSGGFLLLLGSGSLTIVWLTTLFKLFLPTFIYPAGLLNVFYCNKDIITILLTALVTLYMQQKSLLPVSVTGTMWGVWGIMVIIKIIRSVSGVFKEMRN